MRELPIITSDGSLDDCTVAIVQACMQFPDDLYSIEEDISAYRLRAGTGFRDTRLGRYLNSSWRDARLGGMYAGSMLMLMIQFDRYHPDLKVGMNKSAFFVATEAAQFGKPTEKDISTIKKYWREYKNASHLWAAFMHEAKANNFKYPVNFIPIINVAEQLVSLGQSLVESWDPWRTPQVVIETHIEFEVPQPDADDLSLVREYRASKN